MHIKGARFSLPEVNSNNNKRGKNLFKALILLYGQATSIDKSMFRNIIGCYQNRNPSKGFSGDNVISKVLKKLSLVESLFNSNIGLWSILKSITVDFMPIFWNSCTHLMKLQDYSLQPITGLKPALQVLFWKCSEGKGCSKILKTPRNLSKTVTSFLTLQTYSLEFLASTNQTPGK